MLWYLEYCAKDKTIIAKSTQDAYSFFFFCIVEISNDNHTGIYIELLHIYELTTLKGFQKRQVEICFLRFHCNFVTAFNFHHKAAKLNNAGLLFQHFIYNSFTGLQEHLNVIFGPFV